MDTVPLWVLVAALVFLIICSAFFAMAETALMAANKYRLRGMAKRNSRLAANTLRLLERSDRLLSLILIANTLVNAMATALATAIAILAFGYQETVIAAAIVAVAFVLIVFAEVTPKFVGARYPETISLVAGVFLKPLMALGAPLVWFVNLIVTGILILMNVRTGGMAVAQRLAPEELRTMVLEGGNVAQKHKNILMNLFDLEHISVDDIMTPRAQIEALNLAVPVEEITYQLSTCYHNKLPVYEGEINQIVGILHVRHAMALLNEDDLTVEHFRDLLTPPYYIPADTDALTQLQYFQENKERLGIIVDEYGEVQGLVTLDDIIEEMIGEFTTTMPGAARRDGVGWDGRGECLLEGSTLLRDINKKLHLDFPLDGPKTLNGLVLEQLQEIPDAPIALRIGPVVVEVMQVKNQAIKVAKLIKPVN